jgi:hypothetical protein
LAIVTAFMLVGIIAAPASGQSLTISGFTVERAACE